MKVRKASEYVLTRLRHGYYTFSLPDAESVLGPGVNTQQAIYRLVRQGWLFSPSRGFYVIIDPGHQASGFLPVEWFVDDWMKYLKAEYYVGMLTAAMLHGASHQKPQQVQIVSNKELKPIQKRAYSISFFYKKCIPDRCCAQRQSPAGFYKISTPEMTAYDIVRYPKACPSLSMAATVLQELGEKINSDELAALADSGAEVATLQRLGWLLDHTGWSEKTGLLAERLRDKHLVWRPMRPDLPNDGTRDCKWRVIQNVTIEADL